MVKHKPGGTSVSKTASNDTRSSSSSRQSASDSNTESTTNKGTKKVKTSEATVMDVDAPRGGESPLIAVTISQPSYEATAQSQSSSSTSEISAEKMNVSAHPEMENQHTADQPN